MVPLLIIAFALVVMWRFGYMEERQEPYEEAILEVEGRLEWAKSRSRHPFGMESHMKRAEELLAEAKLLWKQNKWDEALRTARQAQKSMDLAQELFVETYRPEKVT